jgi:hypothetical protein
VKLCLTFWLIDALKTEHTLQLATSTFVSYSNHENSFSQLEWNFLHCLDFYRVNTKESWLFILFVSLSIFVFSSYVMLPKQDNVPRYKTKLSLCLIMQAPHHEDVRWNVGIAPPCLTSALDGDEWSASCMSCFTPPPPPPIKGNSTQHLGGCLS